MGGSYAHDGMEVLVGKLNIPLGKNTKISLSMSKVEFLDHFYLSFLIFFLCLF